MLEAFPEPDAAELAADDDPVPLAAGVFFLLDEHALSASAATTPTESAATARRLIGDAGRPCPTGAVPRFGCFM
jgi:hypothetical protein